MDSPGYAMEAERNAEQDTYRDRQGDPQNVETHPSDLADDLKVPYPFDTQAGLDSSRYNKPPSPPVQTTPPPQKEPATNLNGNSVYAIVNPEVQRAQGIIPSNDNFTPRQYSNVNEVRFDSASRKPESRENYRSPLRDRAPTPYTASPNQEEQQAVYNREPTPPDWGEPKHSSAGKLSRKGSSRKNSAHRGLPPQHPPLDHQHSTSKPNSGKPDESVKRVYVESPSFTKEEEEEYRFVSSRLEDIEERDQKTFRDMENKNRAYGGDDNYSRNQKRRYEQDRYENRNRDMLSGKPRANDRYEDRNHDMNGYGNHDNQRNRNMDDQRFRQNDKNLDDQRYEDRNKYGYGRDNDPYDQHEQYMRLQGERKGIEREPHRPVQASPRGRQNTEMDEQDLRKEKEYQRDLKRRLDKQKLKDIERRSDVTSLPKDNNDKENNFVHDSLDFPDERDTVRSQYRDSLEYNNYVQQSQEWGDPPQNPYHEGQGQYYQQHLAKQDSKPDFYDPEDVAKMEIVNPKAPKYDYVEQNKHDYGRPPRKSYRDIVHKKKEEEGKLDHIFISPKVPSKHKGQKKKLPPNSAQPEHLGYEPPIQDQYPLGFKPSSAEELWAKKAAVLSVKKDTASATGKGSASKKPQKWNTNSNVKYAYTYEAPPRVTSSGTNVYKPPNMSYSTGQSSAQEQRGYATPTRHLQPLENKPAPPVATELVPTAVNPASPYRRHMELKPITQEITTEDGQRISVDINLRLISPPPGSGSPNQQLALVPVQESQGQEDIGQQRGVGIPYQMQDMYGNYDNGYDTGYQGIRRQEKAKLDTKKGKNVEKGKKVQFGNGGNQYEYQGNDMLPMDTRYSDVEQQINSEELALADPVGSYSNKYKAIGCKDDEMSTDSKSLAEGYAAIYSKMKNKDPNEHPWYKVYNLNDYKKMQREVRLNRGTLGPDLDTEPYKEKMEKRHKQFEYARMVMEKNRMELGSRKPPQFPRSPPKQGEENLKRKAALEYAKNVPKPSVKPRPNQYNSYEVSAQMTPGKTRGSPSLNKGSPTPAQTVDVIDIRTLEQRHLQERKQADKIRQNMDSVLSQKAH